MNAKHSKPDGGFNGGALSQSQSALSHSMALAFLCRTVRHPLHHYPVATNRYDDWGIPAATNIGKFQYTGQLWLPELGFYYYKARIYSPTLGRFLQTDPIGYEDQVNLYAYVANDPVNNTDPTGLRCGDLNDPGGYCDRENPEDDGSPIVVTGSSTTRSGTKPSTTGGGDGGRPDRKPSVPERPQKEKLSTLEKVKQCAADELGLTALGGALAGAGANILGTRGKLSAATPGTSLASRGASAIFGDLKLPTRLPTLTGFPGIGNGLRLSTTFSAARFAGRAVPVLGYAILAYDVVKIAQCVASDD